MNLWEITQEEHYVDAKSFKKANFIMTLPTPTLYDKRVEFSFQYKVRPEIKNFKTILIAASIKNTFGEVQEYNVGKQKLTRTRRVSFFVYTNREEKLINSDVCFLYLCSDGQKCIVKYHFDKLGMPPALLCVERCAMTTEEKEYFMMLLMSDEESSQASQHTSSEEKKANTSNASSGKILQEYIDALRKETIFLKNNGGKKYKVSNGQRLTSGKEGYCYQFEMESELFLSDDAPLFIDTNTGEHAEGSVLVCEEFQMIIIVNRDLGEKVYKASIGVEPWKLLVAQVDRIERIKAMYHPLAMKLIQEGPAEATKMSIDHIPKGQENVINRVAAEDITVVWGPPGTGKTYTMADIAIDFIQNDKTVLVVSHSNVSVDGLIKKVAGKLRESKQDKILKDGSVFRYGYVRDAELSKDDYASSFNYALNHCLDFKMQMDNVLEEKEDLKRKKAFKGEKLVEIERKLGRLRKKIRNQEKIYVENAKLVGTTISKVTVDELFKFKQYDLVMFDEVSMAYVTQLVCAASFSKSKFLCVGDFMQLPPIAQDKIAKSALERDIFAYLGITDNEGKMYYHPWLVMLNIQRRMYPDIADFVNRRVYAKQLENHATTISKNQFIVDSAPLKGHALNMIDLFGTYAAASKNADNSRFNILSAIISFGAGLSSENDEVKLVGIITPYAAQMRLIRAMIKDYKVRNQTKLTCSTVHQFQGSESDVIVFDAVESYPTSKAGFLMSKDLHAVKRLINVAITRARGKLINVCNSKFWLKEFADKKTHIYYQFVSYLTDQNVVSCQNKQLQKYLAELDTGNNIKIYQTQEECYNRLKKDLDKAQNQIVVSIPDGELKEESDDILALLKIAEKRGVRILMKSNTYSSLPKEWKEYCVGTENAHFPLVMIDERTIWYGIPLSEGKFQVKDWSFTTVCDTLIRIQGENTIEMISSLSELMMKRIGSVVVPLQPKTSDSTGNIMGIPGKFPEWITKKQFCHKCKHHLVLSKGKTGKYYLCCPERICDYREYLTPQMINHYININNVVCPEDGGKLTGRLGKYGVYITCSCNHTIKPDQI